MKINATIHFLDGQILEKEFMSLDKNYPDDICFIGHEPLRIWLEHTPWIEMPDNTFLPASRIAKVTWVEVPAE